jgi:hypothetical protein
MGVACSRPRLQPTKGSERKVRVLPLPAAAFAPSPGPGVVFGVLADMGSTINKKAKSSQSRARGDARQKERKDRGEAIEEGIGRLAPMPVHRRRGDRGGFADAFDGGRIIFLSLLLSEPSALGAPCPGPSSNCISHYWVTKTEGDFNEHPMRHRFA